MRSIGAAFLIAILLVANSSSANGTHEVPDDSGSVDIACILPKDPLFRCNEKVRPTSEQCVKERQYAFEKECITSDQLAVLTHHNGCPVCLGTEYKGWCPSHATSIDPTVQKFEQLRMQAMLIAKQVESFLAALAKVLREETKEL